MKGLALRRLVALAATVFLFTLGFSQVRLKPTDGESTPLTAKSIACAVNLKGPVAEITQTWIFANAVNSGSRFEADMELAVTPGHVLTGFAYWLGEEKVSAFIVSKRRASMIYDAITSRMQDPALIEKIGKDRFRVRIFPVEGGKDLRVELRSVQAMTGGQLRIQFPGDVRRPLEKFSLEIEGLPTAPDWVCENSWKLAVAGTTLRYSKSNTVPQAEFRLTCRPKGTGWWSTGWGAMSGGPVGAFAVTVQSPGSKSSPSLSGLKVSSVHRTRASDGSWLFTGRYQGSGDLTVTLGGSKKRIPMSGDATPNHAALKLWAQAEMDALGTSDKVRRRVIELSERHGLPSHFTSWLAIPVGERERFKEEIRDSVIDELQDEIIELELDKRHKSALYSELNSKLSAELKLAKQSSLESWRQRFWERDWELQDAYAKAVLTEGQARSLRRIASAYDLLQHKAKTPERERVSKLVYEQISWYVGQIGVDWLQERTSYSSFASAIRRSMPHLPADTRREVARGDLTGLGMGWPIADAQRDLTMRKLDASTKLDGSEAKLIARARAKYPRWTEEMCVEGKGSALNQFFQFSRGADGRDVSLPFYDPGRIDDEQITKVLAHLDTKVRQARKLFKTPEIQSALLDYPLIQIGEVDVHRIRQAAREGKRYQGPTWTRRIRDRYGLTASFEQRVYERALYDDFEQYQFQYQASNRNFKEIAVMEASYRYLSKFANIGDWKSWRYRTESADHWWWQYPQTAERSEFLKSLRREPNARPVAETEKAFRDAMKNTQWSRYSKEWIETRINLIKTDVELERLGLHQQTEAIKATIATLQQRRESLRARLGDPVLYVNAPRDARVVTARLPDGEQKVLTWNDSRRQWELRFDVPGYVKDGQYSVQVLVSHADGSKEELCFQYEVDTEEPLAQWRWERTANGWMLVVETAADVARVEAFFANGRRDSLVKAARGRFELMVLSPSAVTLAITDQAHNRSTVEVLEPKDVGSQPGIASYGFRETVSLMARGDSAPCGNERLP